NALRDLAGRKIWRTPCRFRGEGVLNIEDDKVASELFRILREGVINANKHAHASEILLEGCRRKRELVFSVTDNGVGMNGRSKNGCRICGEAGDAAEGMATIRELKPDLVIVDLSLPGANGIELIKNIRAEFAKLPVLILSMHDESLYALRALRAGAQGYVMKQ